MGSLNVLIQALATIQAKVDLLQTQSGTTYDLIDTLAAEIASPIVSAVQNLNVSTNVDFTPVINSINAMNAALASDLATVDSDLKSHIDSMSTALQGLITTSNTDLSSVISSLASLKTSVDAVTTAVNAKIPIFQYTTATKVTVSPAATVSALLFAANANRKGFTIYNNSTNSLYVCIENPAVASNLIDFCGSNAGPTSLVKWLGPGVPTQAITCIRNAGSGNITAWEFT